MPWGDWRGFWLRFVIDGPDPRFLLFFFLPLVPVFWLFPRRHIRLGVVLTSFVFIAYVFGVAFLLFWVALCGVFYLLSERYAVDPATTGQAAVESLGRGGRVHHVVVPDLAGNPNRFTLYTSVNDWLYNHAPWLFPLGARPFSWEAFHVRYVKAMDEPLTANLIAQQTAQMAALAATPDRRNGGLAADVRAGHPHDSHDPLLLGDQARHNPARAAHVLQLPGVQQLRPRSGSGADRAPSRISTRASIAATIAARPRDMLYGLYRIGEGLLKNLVCLIFLAVPMVESAKQLYWAPQAIKSYAVLFFSVHFQVIVLYLYFSGLL